ncbi:MAG: hypothetical protein AzoDbin1_01837 [Azoarcus sp.]|nr:hypothetical protein [Azoarcus sp.]
MDIVSRWVGRIWSAPHNNVLLNIVLVGAIYLAGGLVGRLLAVSPGYASPVWPVAGLALAAVFVLGVKCWPGIWLGAFLLDLWLDRSPAGAAVAGLTASGATIQALLGAWLTRRLYQKTSSRARHENLWRFLFQAGPVACLVSATIGIATLRGFDRLEDSEVLNQWLIWWTGDVVGVLLCMPLALLVWPDADRPKARDLGATVLPLFMTIVLIAVGNVALTRLEQTKALRAAERLKTEAYEAGFLPLPTAIESLSRVERLFAAVGEVSPGQFSTYAADLTSRPGLIVLAWLPRVEAADRSAFEMLSRRGDKHGVRITEQAGDGSLVDARARSVYFPAEFVEPLQHNLTALRFDFASHPARRKAMERAGDTGQPVATEVLRLVQNGRAGVPVFVPVYRLGASPDTMSLMMRRAALRGFVMGSFELEALFAPIARAAQARALAFRVSDITPGDEPRVLASTLSVEAVPNWNRDLLFGGRVWRLELQHLTGLWNPGASMGARAFLGFSVFAAFLITLVVLGSAGRKEAVEALVGERTAELEHELQARRIAEAALRLSENDLDITLQSIGDAVMATDADGRVTRLNPIAERLTGWSRLQAIGRPVQEVFRIINESTRQPAQIPVEEVLRTGEIHGLANHTILIARDGREHAIADSAAPIVDAEGALRGVVLVFRDVTEERRAEIALAASEARYRQFIELAPYGVFVQCEGKFLFLNPKALAMFGGRSQDQLIGRRVVDFVHPDHRGGAAERIRRLNTEQLPAPPLVEKLLRLDGSSFHGEVTAVPYEHEGRAGALVLFQDITARREAEEQRDRFFTLSLDLLCIAGTDGYFKRINPAFTEILGWSEEEILARPFITLVHPDDIPATLQAMERLAANDSVQNFENRYCTKEGAWRWLEWKSLPHPDGLIYATARDVTDQHEAAQRLSQLNLELERRVAERTDALEALNAKEEEIRAVVDNLLEGVVRIDTQGMVVGVNPAVETIFGYRAEEIVGRNVACLMPEPHRSQHDAYLARYLRSGDAHIIGMVREVEGLHKDGRLIPLELSVVEFALRGEHFFIGTLRDISDRKELIADLNAARTDAEQASRAKSAFLAAMSHEIRTPMNGVIGMVDVLANSRLSEHQADLVRTIRESASSLLGIIDDILDFSKIEAGKLDIERAPLSIADLVEGLCNSLVPVAARRGVDLALFISPAIPERVLSDDVRLRQVLYNLVGNAIKFSAGRLDVRGRVSVRVEIAQVTPLRITFRVADNGIGIAPETLGSLFAPFSQAEISTTRRFGGTGLGLAICRRLVELMNGVIEVESSPGSGSRFTVTLPFDIADEQPTRPLPDLAGIDCILIENAELNTGDLRAYLEHAGARVLVASDARAAADLATRAACPAVLIAYAESRLEQTPDLLNEIPNAHCLYITRGRRRRARVAAPDRVILDGDALRRQALLHAVAVASGRASPEIVHDSGNGALDDEAPPPSVAEARALGRLILVAEDDEINQKVILQQLALLGFAAEVASNGNEALQMWRAGHYALLLTDLHMPEMDGYALAEAIRREEAGRRRMPILALTANALRGEANRAHAMGMDAYLTKPIQIHVLRAALEKWLPMPRGLPTKTAMKASGSGKSGASFVNVAVLEALVGDDKEVTRAILEDYLLVARQQAAALHAALAEGDIHSAGKIAHRLKSSSRAIGAAAMGDLCAEIENAGRAEDRVALAQQVAQFDLILGAVLEQVEALITQYK